MLNIKKTPQEVRIDNYRKSQYTALNELKDQVEAREARVKSARMRNDFVKKQQHQNIITEYNKIRQHLNSKLIPGRIGADDRGVLDRKIDIEKLYGFKHTSP